MLPKTKLNAIKVLIAKALIDLYVNHDEFVSVNNVFIKNTANKNYRARKTQQNRLMLVSNCATRNKKKYRSIKNQVTSRLELHWLVLTKFMPDLLLGQTAFNHSVCESSKKIC